MNVRVVRMPLGDAPEWVREAWVGLSLPITGVGPRRWRAITAAGGPATIMDYVRARLTGRTTVIVGYEVNGKIAIERLGGLNAAAAAWWLEQSPAWAAGTVSFLFDTNSCEVECAS